MSGSDNVPASAALSILSTTLTVPMLKLVCLLIQLLNGFTLAKVQPLVRSVHRKIANLDHVTKFENESSKLTCKSQGAPNPCHSLAASPQPVKSV
jgi:hypothetical protein